MYIIVVILVTIPTPRRQLSAGSLSQVPRSKSCPCGFSGLQAERSETPPLLPAAPLSPELDTRPNSCPWSPFTPGTAGCRGSREVPSHRGGDGSLSDRAGPRLLTGVACGASDLRVLGDTAGSAASGQENVWGPHRESTGWCRHRVGSAEPDAHASGALCWANVSRPSRVHCGASKGPVRFPGVLLRGGGAVAPEIEDLLRRQR